MNLPNIPKLPTKKPVHVVHGLTQMRFGLSEILEKLREGHEVEVHSYGFDRKPDGIIKLTFEKLESVE